MRSGLHQIVLTVVDEETCLRDVAGTRGTRLAPVPHNSFYPRVGNQEMKVEPKEEEKKVERRGCKPRTKKELLDRRLKKEEKKEEDKAGESQSH